jgi:dienelactone hydrolase
MTTLPSPTGPYAIGTFTRDWVDPERTDLFAGPDAGPRELMVGVWYPARAPSAPPYARYVEDPSTLEALARLMDLPSDAFSHLGALPTHGMPDAPVARDEARYPVLLFSHGRCGFREHDTFLVEELASHGYVVVTIDHPSAASAVRFPDGRSVPFDPRLLPPWPRHAPDDPERAFLDAVIPFLADDVGSVVRRTADLDAERGGVLEGRLDLDRVGVFGVSLGGVVMAEACVREPALGALLSLDAYVPPDALAAGLRVPAMWLSRDPATMRREGWDEYDVSLAHGSMRAAFDGLAGEGYLVLVPGMYHVDFSDGRLLSPLIAKRGISGPIDGREARRIVRSWSVAFFDRHLKGRPAPLLETPPGATAGLIVERRRAARPVAIGV